MAPKRNRLGEILYVLCLVTWLAVCVTPFALLALLAANIEPIATFMLE